ncbi:rhomboid family intramembrane serine protease [Desulfosoma caldarium]|uniref:Membrane associated rhomboid family serine protease n=1 Tax=Desulfosoma caldarium TaxID=610254 RepID=A0A3N1VHV7_9BACT|nr:rhomboid family intramembrane serine protease [Desulfosoma caldarium]ROR01470.1 membrane associated rhomboid family serine protease [Desulfosoma caldarium]
MIPLRDVNPSRRFPAVTYGIIGLCVLAFFYELALGPGLRIWIYRYGIVPIRYTHLEVASRFSTLEQAIPFVTTMFLHGGWMHLIGNMWVLHIFGDNVESALGRGRYLLFYLLCGLIASLMHIVTNPSSRIPTIGASGAIAGVMGAYFLLYPRARVLTLVPIFFYFSIVEMPAYVFLGLWFVMQFFSGTFALMGGGAQVGGVAWWAHIGGFVAGMVLVKVFRERR